MYVRSEIRSPVTTKKNIKNLFNLSNSEQNLPQNYNCHQKPPDFMKLQKLF